ncbi:hypothetical protein Nepgr_030104 [Nepenthes gracilis]|uniref:Uncharacterized protein n=1 Tax=Nepenthes gracilis TaxID=150966 RepID=A0AAD3Y685_NEPGR|nr:hypothetical protein Nepgr_030104 [Nepenthes gracilis]
MHIGRKKLQQTNAHEFKITNGSDQYLKMTLTGRTEKKALGRRSQKQSDQMKQASQVRGKPYSKFGEHESYLCQWIYGHIDEHLPSKPLAAAAASSNQMGYLQPDHMATVSKDNQAILDQPLPLLRQDDQQLHSFQSESLDLAIVDKDTLIPPNNYFAVLQDSVDSEEPVDSAKEWKTTRKFSVWNDEESFFVSGEIELSRSGMNSQPPPLDAAMEKGLVVARGSVLQPPSLKPAAEEVVVSSKDASTDLRGPSCSREYVTSLHNLQEEDQDIGVPFVDDVESTMAMIEAGTTIYADFFYSSALLLSSVADAVLLAEHEDGFLFGCPLPRCMQQDSAVYAIDNNVAAYVNPGIPLPVRCGGSGEAAISCMRMRLWWSCRF